MNKILVFIIMIAMIILVRCKKYPENKFPILIMPPEKKLEHLVGAKLVEYKQDGISLMNNINNRYKEVKISSYSFELYKDAFNMGQPYPYMSIDSIGWNDEVRYGLIAVHFKDNKSYLTGFGKIIKLTNKELKSEYYENGHKYEMHFKK